MRTLGVLLTGCIATALAQLVPALPPRNTVSVALLAASALALALLVGKRRTPLLLALLPLLPQRLIKPRWAILLRCWLSPLPL